MARKKQISPKQEPAQVTPEAKPVQEVKPPAPKVKKKGKYGWLSREA